ncbi:MAG: GNAT family protein [Chitinophagaceae bacterium]
MANHPDVARLCRTCSHIPIHGRRVEKFIHWTIHNCPSTIMAIIADDQVAGSIGIHPQTDILRTNAEIGYWLGKDFWGMGIMPEAVRMMVPAGFNAYPQIQRIFGRVFGGNTASERVLEKAGFVQEGFFRDTLCKAGRQYDELIYAIRR